MDLRFEVNGADEVTLTYLRRVKILQNLRPLWRELIDVYHHEEAQLFATQGASAGTRWKPLNRRYAKYKAKRWGNRIMIRRGDLLTNLITGDAIWTEAQSVTFGPGPRFWYTRFLNEKRRLTPATAKTARVYREAYSDWLKRKMENPK